MNDIRTEIEKYQAWIDAVNRVWERGWRCETGWVFIAPSGTRHDLSAADLNQLSRIERECLFIANAPVGCSAVESAYPDGVCPDCGEGIPEDAAEGQECTNCGHAFYSLPNN